MEEKDTSINSLHGLIFFKIEKNSECMFDQRDALVKGTTKT